MINAIWYAVWTDIFKRTQAFIQISYVIYACICIYILFIHTVPKPTSRGLDLQQDHLKPIKLRLSFDCVPIC
jgi:hypothetical protein